MKEELKPEIKQSCFTFANNLTAHGAVWEDITTYSRGVEERVPTIFETNVGGCRITIVVGHIYYPNTWIMFCKELNISEKLLPGVTAYEAAQYAIFHCKEKVENMHKAFSKCF